MFCNIIIKLIRYMLNTLKSIDNGKLLSIHFYNNIDGFFFIFTPYFQRPQLSTNMQSARIRSVIICKKSLEGDQ